MRLSPSNGKKKRSHIQIKSYDQEVISVYISLLCVSMGLQRMLCLEIQEDFGRTKKVPRGFFKTTMNTAVVCGKTTQKKKGVLHLWWNSINPSTRQAHPLGHTKLFQVTFSSSVSKIPSSCLVPEPCCRMCRRRGSTLSSSFSLLMI